MILAGPDGEGGAECLRKPALILLTIILGAVTAFERTPAVFLENRE